MRSSAWINVNYQISLNATHFQPKNLQTSVSKKPCIYSKYLPHQMINVQSSYDPLFKQIL